MSDFFTLNGINIPVADGAFSGGQILIGEEGRAFSGAKMDSVRKIKRKWSGTTSIQHPSPAPLSSVIFPHTLEPPLLY
jgi:hypothetical protein